ncbi:MAG TPA: response regulator, partial [Spirochaetota bacterium]|nr:response regulator [Spirochaetota bacterium]
SGIEGEHIDRIFEPFFTTKGSLGHSLIPGTGLGLSVANQVIMNHNGTISVESEKDKGTVFTITLPVNTREILEEEIRRNHKDYNFEDIDVLLIDDDQEFNSILERALENKMARVRTSVTGAQGLAHLEMEKVDLLVLNMHIPDMNGWDILRQIKYLDKKPRIIVISDNYLSMENEDRALIDYVLMKPFDLEELYSAVRDSLIS